MITDQLRALRTLEGHHVSLALVDGSRIDDCELVSVGRPGCGTLWLYTENGDTFVEVARVVDLWECPTRR
jgi:hypothetical protein